MNILYLAHRIPYPPNKGDKLRAFRQIQRLSARHRVWCACFVDDPRDFRYAKDLSRHCHSLATIELRPTTARLKGLDSLLRRGTITEGFYSSRRMRRLLADWQHTTRFDAVVAFSSSMAPYAMAVPAARRVLDLCDLDSGKWHDYAEHLVKNRRFSIHNRLLRWLYEVEGRRLSAAELRWMDGFGATIVATESEAMPVRELVSRRKLHVVCNGVDLPQMEPPATSNGLTVGFVGVMDYFPNVDAVCWFARQVWPMIRREFPAAVFRIVGRSPTRAVRKLAHVPAIEITGEVADVGAELARIDVSVAPLRIARGIQNKVLEAMASAKPVVLTPQAARGVGAVDGRDYLVAPTAESSAQAVCLLLRESSQRSRIGQCARDFIARERRWAPELDKFEALVTGVDSQVAIDRHFLGGVNRSVPAHSLPVLPLRSHPQVPQPSPQPG